MKELIEIIALSMGMCILMGTLTWSLISGEPIPFVIGYPIAVIITFCAWRLNRKSDENKSIKTKNKS